MQAGISIHLDPRGGNSLNVRKLLVDSGYFVRVDEARKLEKAVNDDKIALADESAGALPKGIGAVVEKYSKPSVGRKSTHNAQDEYDFEDDFIDDTELMDAVEQTYSEFLHLESPKQSQADMSQNDEEEFYSNGFPSDDAPHSRNTGIASKNNSHLKPRYSGFYICRGDIPLCAAEDHTKNKGASERTNEHVDEDIRGIGFGGHEDEFPSALPTCTAAGDVASLSATKVPHGKDLSDNSPREPCGSGLDGPQNAGKLDQAGENCSEHDAGSSGKRVTEPATGASASPAALPKKRRISESLNQEPERIPESIAPLLCEMKALCSSLFAEKKPRVNDCVELQEVLHRLLCEARSCGIAKLHSEKRAVAVDDILWSNLGFLRTTRQNLETLGHALYWDDEERNLKDFLAIAEEKLRAAVGTARQRDGHEIWTDEVREELYKWWKLRCSLLHASNQLRDQNRQKSLKKAQPAWFPQLLKACFSDVRVTEDDISLKIRDISDEKTQAAKLRKEEEKRERLAEREERKAKKQRLPDAKQQSFSANVKSEERKPRAGSSIDLLTLASVRPTASSLKPVSMPMREHIPRDSSSDRSTSGHPASGTSVKDSTTYDFGNQPKHSRIVLAGTALVSAASLEKKIAARQSSNLIPDHSQSEKPFDGLPESIGIPSTHAGSASHPNPTLKTSTPVQPSTNTSDFEVIELD